MKTKISIFAFALFALVLNINAQNNYKWIHGLNGTEDSWKIYKEAFTPVNGSMLKYSSDKSITSIAEVVWNENYNQFNQNTILIGHSMGGLVARELERNHSTKIKGIITLGTPHQGAHVAKELQNGKLNALARKTFAKVTNSLQVSTTAFMFTIPGISFPVIVKTNDVMNKLNAAMGVAIGPVVNTVVSSAFNKACSDDLQPGSVFLNRLASRKINVPVLTFASEEDRWQLARVAYCQNNYELLSKDPNVNIDGKFDLGGYNILNTANAIVKTVGHVHTGFAAACVVGGFWYPYLWAASAAHSVAAVNWYSTADYIDNGLDYDHADLVGAYRVDVISEQHKFLWKKWTTYTYVKVPEPHDGVASVKTQQLEKSRGYNVIWANTTIKGVNHMEQRNHFKTRKEFERLLNGETYAPSIFANTNK